MEWRRLGEEVLKENHPLFEYLKKYPWEDIIIWGEVTIRFKEGKPVMVAFKKEYKLD